MPYTPTTWVDPTDAQEIASNFNKIETGLQYATATAESKTAILQLNLTEPVPPGTPAGTLIVRTDSYVPPPAGDYPNMEGAVSVNRSQSANSLTINAPAGVTTGEYLFALVHNQSAGVTSQINATGWTLLKNWPLSALNGHRTTSLLGLEVTDAGALPSSWAFAPASAASARMFGVVWRMSGVDPAAPVGPDFPEPATGKIIPGFSIATNYNRLFSFCIAQVTDTVNNEFPSTSSDTADTLVVDLTTLLAQNASRSSMGLWSRDADAGSVAANTMAFQTVAESGGWAGSFVVQSPQ